MDPPTPPPLPALPTLAGESATAPADADVPAAVEAPVDTGSQNPEPEAGDAVADATADSSQADMPDTVPVASEEDEAAASALPDAELEAQVAEPEPEQQPGPEPEPEPEPEPLSLQPLLEAAKSGDVQGVTSFLQEHGNDKVNVVHDGATALCEALRAGHVGVVEHLLSLPCIDVNKGGPDVPLKIAAQSGRMDLVALLFNHGGVSKDSAQAVNASAGLQQDIRWQCGFLGSVLDDCARVSHTVIANNTNTFLRRRAEVLRFVPKDRQLEVVSESLLQRETVLTTAADETLELPETAGQGHSIAALEALGAHSRRIHDIQKQIAVHSKKGGLDGQAAVEKLAKERAQAAAETTEGLDLVLASLKRVDRQYEHALKVLRAQEKLVTDVDDHAIQDASLGDGMYQLGSEPMRAPSPPPPVPPLRQVEPVQPEPVFIEPEPESSSSEEEPEPPASGMARRASIFGGVKTKKKKKKKKSKKEKAAKAAARAEAHAQRVAEAEAAAAELAAAQTAELRAIAQAEYDAAVAAAEEHQRTSLSRRVAEREAVDRAIAEAEAAELSEILKEVTQPSPPEENSDARVTGAFLGQVLKLWEQAVEGYREAEAEQTKPVAAALSRMNKAVAQQAQLNAQLAAEIMNSAVGDGLIPDVVEVSEAKPSPSATPAGDEPAAAAEEGGKGSDAEAAAGGDAEDATADGDSKGTDEAAEAEQQQVPEATRESRHASFLSVAEQLDELSTRLHRERFGLCLRLLRSERALCKLSRRVYAHRRHFVDAVHRHLTRTIDHVEYQRHQLAELLEEHVLLKIVVRDLLPNSAWAQNADHLRMKVAQLSEAIVVLHDQRDAQHLELRKAERRGQTAVVAEAAGRMRELSSAITELEKTKLLGVEKLNELAGSLFPELMLVPGVVTVEDEDSLIIPTRPFDEFESVSNFFSSKARSSADSSDEDDSSDSDSEPAAAMATGKEDIFGTSRITPASPPRSPTKMVKGSNGATELPMYKATRDGRRVVLKAFAVNFSASTEQLSKELEVLSRLRHPNVLRARSMVIRDTAPDVMSLLELPHWRCNLRRWLRQETPTLQQKQSVARQVLAGLAYLHQHNVTHSDVQPNTVLMSRGDVPMLADYDVGLSEAVLRARSGGPSSPRPSAVDMAKIKGTPGYRAPELEKGQQPTPASDMFSLGILLQWLHTEVEPAATPQLLATGVPQLDALLPHLLAANPKARPSAMSCLATPYFADTLDADASAEAGAGDDAAYQASRRRLNAMRQALHAARSASQRAIAAASDAAEAGVEGADPDAYWLTVDTHADEVTRQVMKTFAEQRLRPCIRVRYQGRAAGGGSLGRAGVDVDGDGLIDVGADGSLHAGVGDGWLLSETFARFFKDVVSPQAHLFETCMHRVGPAAAVAAYGVGKVALKEEWRLSGAAGASVVFMPASRVQTAVELGRLYSTGRVLAGCLLSGHRIGCSIAPAVYKYIAGEKVDVHDLRPFDPTLARTLRWLLAVPGTGSSGLGLTFDGVKEGGADIPLTDHNKEEFVQLLTQQVLIKSREHSLKALKDGFFAGAAECSAEIAAVLNDLSATDLMLLLHGSDNISSELVESSIYSLGFPLDSPIPSWFRRAVGSLSPDDLRRFLVAVMHSPSLPSDVFAKAQLHIAASDRTSGYLVPFGGFGHLSVPSYSTYEELEKELHILIKSTCRR